MSHPFLFERQEIAGLDCGILSWQSAAEQIAEEGPQAIVILCHGYGAGGNDLVPCGGELLESVEGLQNVLFVFPAAPIDLMPGYDSRAWWPLDMELIQTLMAQGQFRELRNDSPDELPARRESMIQLVKTLSGQFQLPLDRFVLGGFSQGSMLTLDVALHLDEIVGGVITWSGTLLNEQVWMEKAAELQSAGGSLRIFQSHGHSDPILPFAGAEALRDALGERGHQVEFLPFAGVHQIPGEALAGAGRLIKTVVAG